MAKITISRIFELSKYLATQAGAQLSDPLTYLSEFAEVTLRNLRNGLTFADNIDCESKRITIQNNTETIVSIASSRRATRIYVDRVIDSVYYSVDSFGWKYNNQGALVIKITFSGVPPSGIAIPVDIVILFA